jgi:hypothetical protein
MNGRAPTEQVEGIVEATNAKGLKIAGQWVNVSQFHPVELPATGDHVRLSVDSKGYIRDIDVLKTETPAVPSARDERITKLAVLKAAAEFAAIRTDIKSQDVLRIADKWLEWVCQD